MKNHYVAGQIDTPMGAISKVGTSLNWRDKLGSLKARATIGRMDYRVEPGLYAVGNPSPGSIVLVSANYKLSFDSLRRELSGIDAWIMVIDTKGINVWCAAGKGTFGTQEIVDRVALTELSKVVNHKNLIVPQLGATGVSAHEVRRLSGFSVSYGPVRARDIRAFLENNMRTTAGMRQVEFSLLNRLELIPAEISTVKTYLLLAGIFFFVLSGLSRGGYSADLAVEKGIYSLLNLLMICLAGAAATPLLLPWLPGRSFSMKGFFAGLVFFAGALFCGFTGQSIVEITGWGLLFSGVTSFMAMNFTGASTYTSLSGVVKEMGVAIPLQLSAVVAGATLWLIARFI